MTFTKSAKLSIFISFFVVGLLSYSNILNAFFLSDDFAQIGKVLAGDLSVTWGESHGGFFRPLFILSYAVDVRLWNRNPLGFHFTNLTLHVLNAFLVLIFSARLMRDAGFSPSQQKRVALLAGLIFLLHPSHTEAVSWISGRADLLATLFFLAAAIFYINFTSAKSRLQLFLSLVAFGCALLSKESAVCLPLAISVIAIIVVKKEGWRVALVRSVKSFLLFSCVLVFYLIARTYMLGTLIGGYGAGQHLNFTHSVIVSQLLRFFVRALFPADALRAIPFLESRLLSPILIVIGCIVATIIIVLLAGSRTRRMISARVRRNAFLWWVLLLFLCCLLPAINLRIDVYSTQGERFLYLPSIFFSTALSYLLVKFAPRAKVWLALVSCLLIFYAATLWKTNEEWRETARLSQSILDDLSAQASQESILILNAPDDLRGVHLYRNGLAEALRSFQTGRGINDARVISYHELLTPEDEINLTEEAGTLTLRLVNDEAGFTKFEAPPPCVEITERADRFWRFRAGECRPTPEVFIFNRGRMIRLPNSFLR